MISHNHVSEFFQISTIQDSRTLGSIGLWTNIEYSAHGLDNQVGWTAVFAVGLLALYKMQTLHFGLFIQNLRHHFSVVNTLALVVGGWPNPQNWLFSCSSLPVLVGFVTISIQSVHLQYTIQFPFSILQKSNKWGTLWGWCLSQNKRKLVERPK
jgi:hypothetical protein